MLGPTPLPTTSWSLQLKVFRINVMIKCYIPAKRIGNISTGSSHVHQFPKCHASLLRLRIFTENLLEFRRHKSVEMFSIRTEYGSTCHNLKISLLCVDPKKWNATEIDSSITCPLNHRLRSRCRVSLGECSWCRLETMDQVSTTVRITHYDSLAALLHSSPTMPTEICSTLMLATS